MSRRLVALVVMAAVGAFAIVPVTAYLKLGGTFGGRTVTLHWQQFPIAYFVTDRGVPGVTAQQLQTAVSRAFDSWHAVETSRTSSQFAGFTAANPFLDDDRSVIGFMNRPDLERVLGATTFIIDITDGEIIESDIFLNSDFPWSVSPTGEQGRHDVESIMLHELGHLLGLGHSAIGETELVPGGRRVLAAEAVMFPIAFQAGSIADRVLKPDDRAGVSDIYPATDFRRTTGSVSGRVTKQGQPVRGAHVVAFNPRTGHLVAGFSLGVDGRFAIAGLEPGPHVIRVEPLDDAEIESFFDRSVPVDINFRVKFHDRLVVVPRGGDAGNIELQVVPK